MTFEEAICKTDLDKDLWATRDPDNVPLRIGFQRNKQAVLCPDSSMIEMEFDPRIFHKIPDLDKSVSWVLVRVVKDKCN